MRSDSLQGQIYKVLSGFYYVRTADGKIYQTRGRGNFRKKGLKPLVGDWVEFTSDNDKEGMITAIEPRKNELQRPPVANIDQVIIVMSAVEPDFSPALLDRFIVQCESLKIKPLLYWTKMDCLTPSQKEKMDEWKAIYEAIGYSVFYGDLTKPSVTLLEQLNDKITVLMGQSGVGKSTLLNQIIPSLQLKTGEISTSLGRGRHTTRHVELISVMNGLVADTPGFSALDFEELIPIDLANSFVEFKSLADQCKFRGCLHHNEPQCAIKEAVESGKIAKQRYEDYLLMLAEIQNRRPNYQKRKKSE